MEMDGNYYPTCRPSIREKICTFQKYSFQILYDFQRLFSRYFGKIDEITTAFERNCSMGLERERRKECGSPKVWFILKGNTALVILLSTPARAGFTGV